MDQGGAYGAGKSGEAFNIITFFKQPKTILRVLSWVFSLIVFGCIVAEGNDPKVGCVFGKDQGACSYGIIIGVFAFIISLAFFVADLIFPSISSASKRKKIVMADLGLSGAWTFLYFVSFCVLTNAWMSPDSSTVNNADNARAAITFSFFSIGSWAGLTYFALQSYRQGTLSAFAPSYQDPMQTESSAPYTSFPSAAEMSSPTNNYQQGPFTSEEKPSAEYQPPTY